MPRVLISDQLSPAAIAIFRDRGVDVDVNVGLKKDELLKIIDQGRPRTAMPAWKDRLSDEEQREVLRYIRSLVHFHQPATPPPPASAGP